MRRLSSLNIELLGNGVTCLSGFLIDNLLYLSYFVLIQVLLGPLTDLRLSTAVKSVSAAFSSLRTLTENERATFKKTVNF